MSDPVKATSAPAATTEISFTEHPVEYISAKVTAAIDYFTSEPAPAAPAVVAKPAQQTPVAARYYSTSFADCDTTIAGFSRCR